MHLLCAAPGRQGVGEPPRGSGGVGVGGEVGDRAAVMKGGVNGRIRQLVRQREEVSLRSLQVRLQGAHSALRLLKTCQP